MPTSWENLFRPTMSAEVLGDFRVRQLLQEASLYEERVFVGIMSNVMILRFAIPGRWPSRCRCLRLPEIVLAALYNAFFYVARLPAALGVSHQRIEQERKILCNAELLHRRPSREGASRSNDQRSYAVPAAYLTPPLPTASRSLTSSWRSSPATCHRPTSSLFSTTSNQTQLRR